MVHLNGGFPPPSLRFRHLRLGHSLSVDADFPDRNEVRAPIPFFAARLRPRGHQKSQLIKQLVGSGRKP